MLFAITAYDDEQKTGLRAQTRPAHLHYLKSAGARVKLAGPLLSPGDNPKPIGSLILIDAASEAAVKLFVATDPYSQAGLFKQVTIQPFTAALGAWLKEAQ